jgi:hypothetical protein
MLASTDTAQLEGWLHAGHTAAVAGKSAVAADAWLQCWDVFARRWPAERVSLADAQQHCPELTEPLGQWLRDVEEELAEAGGRSAAHRERRLQFCEDVLSRFDLDVEEDRLNFLCARAAALWELKQREAAEAAFAAAAEEYSHEAGAFVRWGDCWAFNRPPDFDRAEAIYRQGLEPAEQCDLRTISHRLEILVRLRESAAEKAARASDKPDKPRKVARSK